jgi:hypothetical protein
MQNRMSRNVRHSQNSSITAPGQYQFLFGYGGGMHEETSLATNAIGFDLNDRGFASLVQ